MRRAMVQWCGRLSVVVLLLVGGRAQGGHAIPEPSFAQRVALADCVFVGRVTEIEADLVDAFPLVKIGPAKVPYRIATIRVDKAIAGADGLEQLRVGALATAQPIVGMTGTTRRPRVELKAEQEGCFFLRKHPDESFCVATDPWDVLDKKTQDFDKDLAYVQRCAPLLAKPDMGLRSKDAEDRILTAAMLIFRYRTARWIYAGAPKLEGIDPDESKLILAALAEGSWTEKDARTRPNRPRLFFRLGLTAKDGWMAPANLKEVPDAAKKWVEANAAYRIQRYAPEK